MSACPETADAEHQRDKRRDGARREAEERSHFRLIQQRAVRECRRGEEQRDREPETRCAAEDEQITTSKRSWKSGSKSFPSQRRSEHTDRFSDSQRDEHNPGAHTDVPNGNSGVDQAKHEQDDFCRHSEGLQHRSLHSMDSCNATCLPVAIAWLAFALTEAVS